MLCAFADPRLNDAMNTNDRIPEIAPGLADRPTHFSAVLQILSRWSVSIVERMPPRTITSLESACRAPRLALSSGRNGEWANGRTGELGDGRW